MAKVKILLEGYTSDDGKNTNDGNEKTCATITLVQDEGINIVVDPGVLESQHILKEALKKEGLEISDIDYVFLTHSHIDHYRNAGMFPEAKILEFFGLWENNSVEDLPEQVSKDVKIIKTPGHEKTSLTLLVKTEEGLVAVCGDVFWKEDFPESDPYADDPKKLLESRKKIKEIADWIVPGHSGMYKVKK